MRSQLRFGKEGLPRSVLSEHFRDILDSIPDGVFTVDPEWRITSMNRAAARTVGIPVEDAIGKFCYRVFNTDVCRKECPLALTLESGKDVVDFDVFVRDCEGVKCPLSVNAAILRAGSGTPIGGVVSYRRLSFLIDTGEGLDEDPDFHGLIGRSLPMRRLYALIREVADSDATVLVEGESGTGKELVANAVQTLSRRKEKPFVKVNCAAFVETLLETELFGHVKGAFTDAREDRAGRFETADGGTLFLDEIGQASQAVQLRLLRVLQEREFERVGDVTPVSVDVRIITATNRSLEDLVQEGTFREDLFYRLHVVPIHVPPLRERGEDILILTRYFLRRNSILTGRRLVELSPRAAQLLLRYHWPGNVRELENAVEYALVQSKGKAIRPAHLPLPIAQTTLRSREDGVIPDLWKTSVLGEEESMLLEALRASRWRRSEAARRLGISRTTLWRRMTSCGLIGSGSRPSS